MYRQRRQKGKTAVKINTAKIVNERECRIHYQYELNSSLWKIKQNSNPNNEWKETQAAMKYAGEESAGSINTTKNKPNRTPNIAINDLSRQQKELRIRIQNTKDSEEIINLKTERNKILHSIRSLTIKHRNEELDKKVEDIEKSKNNASSMFKATKSLNRKPFENPKLQDKFGKQTTNPNDILDIVTDHFQQKFHKQVSQISPFSGNPRDLNNRITTTEVRNSIKCLNNNRSPGEDEIPAELLKCGTFSLDLSIANIMNKTFSTHKDWDINSGVLITIQKPGKTKGPVNNLRPITLLNTIRKTLSTIVLNRIRPKIEKYLSHSQSGFRQDRSTSDVVWTHKWLAAKALKENISITITGIDMSAAFDTIDRGKLLEILTDIVDEDELRIIRFLLSNTKIQPRIYGATKQTQFESNIGTPQGDSLSPILFTIYLEHALKEVRKVIPKPTTQIENAIPREIAYADDVDFIGSTPADIDIIQNTLIKYNLQVNANKTEFTTISRNKEEWKRTKKVGSLIGDTEDVQRRKQLSNAALSKLTNVWIRGDKIKRKTKLKLYRALVKPVLLYNCGTWALTKSEEEHLDAFHRTQLRRVLNIKYPKKISNESLYKITKERPISLDILQQRWQLFGHILRRDKNIPANQAMSGYFQKHGNLFRGRPITTLPVILNKNLTTLGQNISLRTAGDLENLRTLAEDRQHWRHLTQEILETAKATRSFGRDAKCI